MVPFHFWSGVFLALGCIVGSFLNVCIHRLPRDQSLVSPGSHCPSCGQSIPWYLNIPLLSWVMLRGRCRFCKARISARYVLVEALTGVLFLFCWLEYGRVSAGAALLYGLFMAGLVAASFIDLEHYIIPDSITLGGVAAGVVGAVFVPALHGEKTTVRALQGALLGAAVGGAVIWAIVRVGKLVFGRHRLRLEPGTRVYFQEEGLSIAGESHPYQDLLYRPNDAIQLHAQTVELPDRGYRDVDVRMTRTTLRVGVQEWPTEEIPCLEAVADVITLPREAMGEGDVKFMAAIGAFVGWDGVLFSLMASALVGSIVGLTLVLTRMQDRSKPIPYGPYLALAAAVWVFAGDPIVNWWLGP